MKVLAKKHEDQNHRIYENNMLSMNCGLNNGNGEILPFEYINHKHCQYMRDKYDTEWMDKLYGFCVGEQFNIYTKQKNISNKKGFECSPPDFTNEVPSTCHSSSLTGRYKNHKQ